MGLATRPLLCLCLLGALTLPAASEWRTKIQRSALEHVKSAQRDLAEGLVPRALAHARTILLPRDIRIAIDAGPADPIAAEALRRAAISAADQWERALGREVRFFWTDPSSAEVRVTFAPSVRLGGAEVAGKAVWRRGILDWGHGQADYTLSATIHVRTELDGRAFPEPAIRQTLLHELGHVLGLDDSPVLGHVMGPVDPSRPVSEPALSELESLLALRDAARQVEAASFLSLHDRPGAVR